MNVANSNGLVTGLSEAADCESSASLRVKAIKLLLVASFVLCMSAPEELFFSQVEVELNPYAGVVKLTLLGLALTILLFCRSRKHNWAVAGPFAMLIAWAAVCWLVSGAEILPGRNLVSSFGGILVLAAFCGAAELVGGISAMVRLLTWALLVTATLSLLFGLMGLQPLPGQSRLPGEPEWFHGVGLPWYAVSGCAVLVAWALARHFSGAGTWLEPKILLLLAIPALAFLRAFLIGILVSILFATVLAVLISRKRTSLSRRANLPRYRRLVLLSAITLAVGAIVFVIKTGVRAEGEELSGREIIWPIEIASVLQNPIFGLGPFGDVELLRFKEDLPQVGAAHSDYLAAAVCYGIPGLGLFVGALYMMWRRIVRYVPAGVEERACRFAALFSLIGVSTTMIAENVIRDPRLFSLHLLFPALCLSAAVKRGKAAV